MTSQTDFDVVIIGAGPGGCGMASGLRHAGVTNIAIVDKPMQLPFRIGESATPDVPHLLHQLGLPFDETPHRLYTHNLVAWGTEQAEAGDFLFKGYANGWHLNRQAFDDALKQQVLNDDVAIFTPNWISAVMPWQVSQQQPTGWQINLHGGETIQAKIVIDASGRNASFCKRIGVQRTKLDALIALACKVKNNSKLQGASFINTCEHGWWYAVDLNDGYSLVTLMTDTPIAKKRGLQDAEVFKQAWAENNLLCNYVSLPKQAQRPHTFAAYTSYLQRAAGKNWLAIGDALMSFDPLTSSGISGALTDAVAAVPVVMAMLQHNYHPAKQYALRADVTFKRYLTQRAAHYAHETRWRDAPFWKLRMPETLYSQQKQALQESY